MLTLKDGDLLIDYGSNQCQVYMQDEFVPFLNPSIMDSAYQKLNWKLSTNT